MKSYEPFELCVAKNAGLNFEYFSKSKQKWIAFDDLHEEHFKNVIKLILREGSEKLFRITYENELKEPIGGEFIKVHIEKCV
jgi:hypothetical protein